MSIAGMINVLHVVMQEAMKSANVDTLTANTNMVSVNPYGFTMLGFGYFSMVVTHPAMPDIVFKVGSCSHGVPNDGWPVYAGYCLFHDCKEDWMPKISALHIYPDMYVAAMERLDARHPGYTVSNNIVARDANLEHKGLAACSKACGFYDRDLHGDNIMWRGETLVITDPFAHFYNAKEDKATIWLGSSSNPLTATGKAVNKDAIKTNLDRVEAHARLANPMPIVTAERKAEDRPLRQQPQHVDQAQIERLVRVLSPLWGGPFLAKEVASFIERAIQCCNGQGRNVYSDGGLYVHVRDGRLHFSVSITLVLHSRHRREYEARVQRWLDETLRQGADTTGLRRNPFLAAVNFVPDAKPRRHWPEVPFGGPGQQIQDSMAIEKAQPIIAQPEVRRDRDGRRPIGNAHWPVPPIRRLMRDFV